jgi:L-lactate dehydrogenase (cytochrome)
MRPCGYVAAKSPLIRTIIRGGDIAKALSLGARAVLAGRAYAYGLGAAGGDGVSRAIEILRSDLVRTLKRLGCASVAELGRTHVGIPEAWAVRTTPQLR